MIQPQTRSCICTQVKELEIGVRRVQSSFAWMKRPREASAMSAAEIVMDHLCKYGRTHNRGSTADAVSRAAEQRAPVRARIGMKAVETSR